MACWTRSGGTDRRPADMELAAPGLFEASAPVQAGAVLGGDFYTAPPTLRGVCLLLGQPDIPGGACHAKLSLPTPWRHGGCPTVAACKVEAESGCDFDSFPQLLAADEPQPVPQDPLFQLERTTLFLEPPPTHTPRDIMEEYARFLRVSTHTVPLPMDAEAGPFRSKAKLLSEVGSCVVVATLFGLGDGRYALECQRRYGDCVAFHRAFRQLARHFAGWLSRESGTCPQPPPPDADAGFFAQPAAPSEAGHPGDAALGPLLDGVVQPAEVAAVLAAIARTGPAAAPQGSERVLHVVRQLVQSDDVEVAFFAARALAPAAAGAKWESGILA